MSEEGGAVDTGASVADVPANSAGGDAGGAWYDGLENADKVSHLPGVNDLANSWVSAQELVERSIRIPTQEASQDQINGFYDKLTSVPGVVRMPNTDDPDAMGNFYNQIGRPAEYTGYVYNDPEGYERDTDMDVNFSKAAHEMGLTQHQADGLRSHFIERAQENMANMDAQYDAALTNLKSEWGPAFDRNVETGKQALAALNSALPGLIDDLTEKGLTEDPTIIKLFAHLGERIQEPQAELPGSPSYVMTPAEAEQRITDARANPDHPIRNPSHPQYDTAKAEFDRWYAIARGVPLPPTH